MPKYVNPVTGKEVLEPLGIRDITDLLREEDRRPVRNLVDFLLLNKGKAPAIYLGGSALDKDYPREYGDIDLLAVYSDDRGKFETTDTLLSLKNEILTRRGIKVPSIKFKKTEYLITYEGEARTYLNMNIDESFLLEPFRVSPAMKRVILVGAPIELCLSSRENFERDYRRIE